jgi:hypothetical protein
MIVSNNSSTELWRLQCGYVIHMGLHFSNRKHFFTKIENNDIQQMYFGMFIIYTSTRKYFGLSGPSSGSYTQ